MFQSNFGHSRQQDTLSYSCIPQKNISLHKHKINRRNQTDECCDMIPVQRLTLKKERCKQRKDDKGYHFLNHFQLHQRERTSIADKSDTVGRNLAGILT